MGTAFFRIRRANLSRWLLLLLVIIWCSLSFSCSGSGTRKGPYYYDPSKDKSLQEKNKTPSPSVKKRYYYDPT